MDTKYKSEINQLIILAILVGAITFTVFKYLSFSKILPENAELTEFSAERAYNHLESIAQQPRRMFQPYYNESRDYLISELKKLGIDTEIQNSTAHHPSAIKYYSSVENIIARIKGTSGSGDAILVVGHFDSEPFESPGALDNASAVAVMIEIARSLKAAPELVNDIILLFSSAHEPGVQGATAFITEHPWARQVKVVLNLEAASRGKMVLLATGQNNGMVVEGLAKSFPRSFLYSAITSLNPSPDTDFGRAFKPAGYAGLDFNCLMTSFRQHHSRLDNLDNVRLKSLQEYGSNLYSLVRHFGTINLKEIQEEDDHIFFNILNKIVIHYPKSYSIPLLILTAFIFVLTLFLGFKRQLITMSGIGITVLGAMLATGSSIGIISFLWHLVSSWHPMYQFLFNGIEYNSLLFYIAFGSLAVIMAFFSFYMIQKIKRISQTDLLMGVATFGFLSALIASVTFPEMGYFPTWITLFLLIATAYWFYSYKAGRSGLTLLQTGFFILSGLVNIVLTVPFILASYSTTPSDPLRYISILTLVIFLMPIVYSTVDRIKIPVFSLFGLVTVIFLIIALSDDFGPNKPRVTYVSCLYDADRKQAFWLTDNLYQTSLDTYSAQFVKEDSKPESVRRYIPDHPFDYEAYFTPVLIDSFSGPKLEVLDDTSTAGIRTLKLHISSMQNAHEISAFKNPDLVVIEYSINGVKCHTLFGEKEESSSNVVLFHYRNVPANGIYFKMKVKTGLPIVLKLRERIHKLPQVDSIKPMSENMIPWIDYGAHTTYVIKSYKL